MKTAYTMDRFYLCFFSLIFNLSIWISTVVAEGPCQHACLKEERCNVISVQNRCYYVYKDRERTWEQSNYHCQAEGLQMTILNNKVLNNIIIEDLIGNLPARLKVSRTRVWLGGRTVNYPSWSFLNGTTVKNSQLDIWQIPYTGWLYWGHCGIFAPNRAGSFHISIQDCHTVGHFLCRIDKCETPAAESCLRLLEEPKTWFEARLHCIGMGGDLFYLRESERLSDFGLGEGSLHDAIAQSSKDVFIGMVHRQWEWHDKSQIIYTNWASGEPNTFSQECLMMLGDTGEWDDIQCYTALLTLCQEDIIEISTTTSMIMTQSFIEQNGNSSNQGGPATLNGAESSELTTTSSSSTTSVFVANGKATNGNFIGQDPKTNRMIILIMAVLLGVFFLFSITLIIYITCRRRRKEVEVEDAEFIDNNYYEGTVERTVNDAPERVATNSINGKAGDRAIVPEKPTTLPSYEDVHLYGNDVTDSMPKNKPVIKPKPKIGPVNGDVYSQVDQVRPASPMSTNNTTYMNAN